MRVSKHPVLFLIIKLSQILVCTIVLILELVSFFAWSNYVNKLNESNLYPQIHITKSTYFEKQTIPSNQSITYNGQVKIWYYIVIGITLLGTIAYVTKYRWLWDHALRLILMELFFFALWFSAGVANFDPWYSGPGLRCNLVRTDYTNPVITKLAELAQLQCNTHVASLSFGWINVGLYVISLLMARKRSSELDWTSVPSSSHSNEINNEAVDENVVEPRRTSRGPFALRPTKRPAAFF